MADNNNEIWTNGNVRASDDDFKLDTESFDAVANKATSLANDMASLKYSLDLDRNELLKTWNGEGRDTFEKKYRVLIQQLGDLSDSLYDIAKEILEKERAYIQRDTDLSKQMDGVDNRY